MSIPLRPVIDVYNDPAQGQLFNSEGAAGMVRQYAIPTLALGYGVPIVRDLHPDLSPGGMVERWDAAFKDQGLGWTLYFNPADFNDNDLEPIRRLRINTIVEGVGMGSDGWLIGALASLGQVEATEPMADREGPDWVWDIPCCLRDTDYRNGIAQSSGWFPHQWPPNDWKPGVWRWYEQPSDPHATRETILKRVQVWYAEQAAQSWCKLGLVSASLAAVQGISFKEIAGSA